MVTRPRTGPPIFTTYYICGIMLALRRCVVVIGGSHFNKRPTMWVTERMWTTRTAIQRWGGARANSLAFPISCTNTLKFRSSQIVIVIMLLHASVFGSKYLTIYQDVCSVWGLYKQMETFVKIEMGMWSSRFAVNKNRKRVYVLFVEYEYAYVNCACNECPFFGIE